MIAPTGTLPNLPLAADCERLVVGEWYLVPCANGIPIVGEAHTDNDHFNNTPHHYHCDSRFHDDRQGRAANCAIYANLAELTVEARQCIRDTPAMWVGEDFAVATMALYADYGFARSACGLCPHKGMPILNGVCSGHRLEWLPDGTIKHKPPYTFRIRGTNNTLTIIERIELEIIAIPVVEQVEGSFHLDMLDRDGARIASKTVADIGRLNPGDVFKFYFKKRRANYD